MSFFSDLKRRASELTQGMKEEVKKVKNQSFLDAAVAACTAVAYADGIASAEEKAKLIGAMKNSDALSVFNTDEVIKVFQKYASRFDFDIAIGKADALAAISKLRGKSTESNLLIRVCLVIAAADGNFDDKEKAVIAEICRELNLAAADFGL